MQLQKNHPQCSSIIPPARVYDEIIFSPWTAAVIRTESIDWDDKSVQDRLEFNNCGILRSKTIRRIIQLVTMAFLCIPYLFVKAIHKANVKRKNRETQLHFKISQLEQQLKIISQEQEEMVNKQAQLEVLFQEATDHKLAISLQSPFGLQQPSIKKGLQNCPNMVRGRMNVCFMNSAIQCFAHIPKLKDFIKNCTPNPNRLKLKSTLLDLLNELDNKKGEHTKVNTLHLDFTNETKKVLAAIKSGKKQAKKTSASDIPSASEFKLDGRQQDPSEFIAWLFNQLVTKPEHYTRPYNVQDEERKSLDDHKKVIRTRKSQQTLPAIFISENDILFKVKERKTLLHTQLEPSVCEEKYLYNLNHPNEKKKFLVYPGSYKTKVVKGKKTSVKKSAKKMAEDLAVYINKGYSVGTEVHTTMRKTHIVGQNFLFIRNEFTASSPKEFPLTFYLPSGEKYVLEGAMCHTVGRRNPKDPTLARHGHYIAKVKRVRKWLTFNDLGFSRGVLGQITRAPTKSSDNGFLYVYTLQPNNSLQAGTQKT